MPATQRHATPPPPSQSATSVSELEPRAEAEPKRQSRIQSRILGYVGCFTNILLLYHLGSALLALRESRDTNHFQGSREELYGVLLTAGCPRCALISKATCEDSVLWWHNDTVLSSVVAGSKPQLAEKAPENKQLLAKIGETTKSALGWCLAPSFLISFDPSSGIGAWTSSPVQTYVLYFSVWTVLIQDLLYLLITIKLLIQGNLLGALSCAVAIISRNIVLWGYAWLFYFVYPWTVWLRGADHLLLGLGLILILLLRVASIVMALGSLCIDDDFVSWQTGISAICGTLAAGVPIASGMWAIPLVPFAEIGLSEIGIPILFAFISYRIIIYQFAANAPIAILCANVLFVEQLLDLGFANVLLLDTLRHKTSLMGYMSIRLHGGLTAHGGKKTGSTEGAGVPDDTRGKFYLFKDTFSGERDDCDQTSIDRIISPEKVFFNLPNMIQPNKHAFFSARSSISAMLVGKPFQDLRLPKHLLAATVSEIWGICAVLMPSLKFRFTLDDMATQQLKNDPLYGGIAWFTYEDVSASCIGPWGTVSAADRLLWQGYLREITRMPWRALQKFATGMFQLLLAAIWVELVDIKESPVVFLLLPWM